MALDSYMYNLTPEEIAIRHEQEALRKYRACGQCRHKVSVEWKGETHHGCEFKRRRYGTRCELYDNNKGKK